MELVIDDARRICQRSVDNRTLQHRAVSPASSGTALINPQPLASVAVIPFTVKVGSVALDRPTVLASLGREPAAVTTLRLAPGSAKARSWRNLTWILSINLF